jgi:hypothetical protein
MLSGVSACSTYTSNIITTDIKYYPYKSNLLGTYWRYESWQWFHQSEIETGAIKALNYPLPDEECACTLLIHYYRWQEP